MPVLQCFHFRTLRFSHCDSKKGHVMRDAWISYRTCLSHIYMWEKYYLVNKMTFQYMNYYLTCCSSDGQYKWLINLLFLLWSSDHTDAVLWFSWLASLSHVLLHRNEPNKCEYVCCINLTCNKSKQITTNTLRYNLNTCLTFYNRQF